MKTTFYPFKLTTGSNDADGYIGADWVRSLPLELVRQTDMPNGVVCRLSTVRLDDAPLCLHVT